MRGRRILNFNRTSINWNLRYLFNLRSLVKPSSERVTGRLSILRSVQVNSLDLHATLLQKINIVDRTNIINLNVLLSLISQYYLNSTLCTSSRREGSPGSHFLSHMQGQMDYLEQLIQLISKQSTVLKLTMEESTHLHSIQPLRIVR